MSPAMLRKSVVNDGDGVGRAKPKKIQSIQFGILSGTDIERASDLRVSSKQLYDIGTRQPVPYGCLDSRLGVSDKTSECGTCGKKLVECIGHFGHIKLELPVFHIGYYKAIQNVLQSICKVCGTVLVKPSERNRLILKMRNPNLDSIGKAGVRKKILDACKKVRQCFRCGAFNGTVKKVQGSETLKLVHEKYKVKEFEKHDNAGEVRMKAFETAMQHNFELDGALIRKTQESLNPQMVLELFKRIKDEDLPLLWASAEHSRPENMILTHMIVPPVAIRPSVKMDTMGTNEDDLTSKLQEILDVNNELATELAQGVKMKKIQEHWNVLQQRVSSFINGDLPGLPAHVRRDIKSIRGLVQRLKGKQGRFRGNLSGKRVDFSGRTVISPDPNLSIHQVGVPVHMAVKLTYPEMVNSHNIERLRTMIRRGPYQHPGANYVRQVTDLDNGTNPAAKTEDMLRSLQYGNPNIVAKELKIGDIVERHVCDDDIVLFNRQPSLHKMSIMSHRVKVLPGRTLRFNECVCAPYNADFDGDEMNLHVPQTEEARAEADHLMGVRNNLITPRNGEPLITATQDFITSAYLMTSRDRFYTKEKFCQIVSTIGDATEHIDLPPPAIIHPRRLWTGKQVWNVLLRPNLTNKEYPRVTLETNERSYRKDLGMKAMCPNEGYVVFRDSELLCGSIGKGTLGDSKSGLVYVLIRDYSSEVAARVMNRMTKVCTRWLTEFGFSIGLEDVTPGEALLAGKAEEIGKGYDICEKLLSEYKSGTLVSRPGCNMEESLESEMSSELSRVRDTSGKMCMDKLPHSNSAYVMATCGSKGSSINICQMMVCVGQQVVGGKRMPDGFVRRTLPHFELDAKHPSAKGFVANSFYSGLTAPEFFFHTMGGREGLVDTAVKTAETGYMARRLMKALEDLSVRYDGTVRNATEGIVQFKYGDDGLNPSFMEDGERPVNFARLEGFIKPLHRDVEGKALTPLGLRKELSERYYNWSKIIETTGQFDSLATTENNPGLKFFVAEVHDYIESVSVKLEQACENLEISASLMENILELPLSQDTEIKAYRDKMVAKHGSIETWAHSAQNKENVDEHRGSSYICLNSLCRTTRKQLETIISTAVSRFLLAQTEPGEAVGAIGAQSLGEPGTQMTLKTFHFAGVASMNVTLGVPRIKEIINASKNISTPIITVKLVNEEEERSARIVKARLEATRLSDVAIEVVQRFSTSRCTIVIHLDKEAIRKLHLDITDNSVRHAILNHKPLKFKDSNWVTVTGNGQIMVNVDPSHKISTGRASSTTANLDNDNSASGKEKDPKALYFNMQAMKDMLMDVIVQGIPSIQRAVISHDEKNNDKFQLLVEGLGLDGVLGTPGVDAAYTKTNHIMEMERVLGIEAARALVMEEVDYIFSRYGLSIDSRHLKLLADVMSYRGQILGITRFGIAKMKESVLMLASFEKTADHLFDAATHARKDDILGVSERIITGGNVPLGTGMFKLLSEWENKELPKERVTPRESLLFD